MKESQDCSAYLLCIISNRKIKIKRFSVGQEKWTSIDIKIAQKDHKGSKKGMVTSAKSYMVFSTVQELQKQYQDAANPV